MKTVVSVCLAALLAGRYCHADEALVRNAINDLHTFCVTSKTESVATIREWGFFDDLYDKAPFTNACAVVSNNWQYAMNDWAYYSTNSEARLFFQNLCGFAGTNTLVGVWNRMLDIASVNTNACSPMTISWLYAAPATPLEGYVILNYDNPAISNCLIRTRQLFQPGSDDRLYYDKVLSGERKIEWEVENGIMQSDDETDRQRN